MAEEHRSRWRAGLIHDYEVVGQGPDTTTYPTPEHGWVCFHCGEHFTGDMAGWHRARDHFGWKPTATPVCVLTKEDRGLLRALRAAERQLSDLKAAAAPMSDGERADG